MSTLSEPAPVMLRKLRERSGLSMDDLARAMGYARASSIQRYENPDEYTKEFFSPDLALKMTKAMAGKGTPPIEPREIWDLTGISQSVKGMRMISSYDPDDAETGPDEPASYSREHWKPKIKGAIPEIDMKFGAGNGVVADEHINLQVGDSSISGHPVLNEWLLPELYLRHELKVSTTQTIIQEIIGDSMIPTYMPGDRVIVDLAQNRFVSDTVYAISDGFSEPQIKRLQRIPFSNPAEVRIISDNQTLEAFTVLLEKLTIIGRVCGHIARK